MRVDAQFGWGISSGFPSLETGGVDVWCLDLGLAAGCAEAAAGVLSAEETTRAGRFHFEHDRTRYILTRGYLRSLLADYLKRQPAELGLALDAHGKPFLQEDGEAGGSGRIHFNVSHSGGQALLAFCRDGEVGVDIEGAREETEWEGLAERFFSSREVEDLKSLKVEDRKPAFLRCWTRKEAYVKAKGLGLSLGLDSFAVSVKADEAACLKWCQEGEEERRRWQMWGLPVPEGFTGAVVGPAACQTLRLFSCQEEARLSSRLGWIQNGA